MGELHEMERDAVLPRPGDILLEKFRIEHVVGRGGMGVVYAAHHLLLDQRVALKLLAPEVTGDLELVSRFLNEAPMSARIKSEHVCRVMDVGTLPCGLPYIAMEFLEGMDLAQILEERGPLPVAEVASYAIEALDALAQAHAAGIVHRDLKPSNIFVTQSDGNPFVKILDFGISKLDGGLGTPLLAGVTTSRAILGSPTYMSPEQIKNSKKTDQRGDIWSMGVILFELLTARCPFEGETPGEIFAKIIEGDVPRMGLYSPDVPEAFEDIVRRCLARDREERFANAAELAEAIAPFSGSPQRDSLERIRRSSGRSSIPAASSIRPAPSNPAPTGSEAKTLVKEREDPTEVTDASFVGRAPPRKKPRGAMRAALVGLAVSGTLAAAGPLVAWKGTPRSSESEAVAARSAAPIVAAVPTQLTVVAPATASATSSPSAAPSTRAPRAVSSPASAPPKSVARPPAPEPDASSRKKILLKDRY